MALLAGAAASLEAIGAAALPNFLVIVADDLSWKHLGAYGSREVRTPNLDRLAREGVVFENAFVSTPSCTPSRAAILTGRNGFELGPGATLWGYLPAKHPTYPELLEQQGYRNGTTGKGWGPGFLIDRAINPAGKPYNQIRRTPFSEHFDEVQLSDIDYAANFEAFLAVGPQDGPFAFWMGTFEPHRGYTEGLAAFQGRRSEDVSVPAFLPDAKAVRNDLNEYYAEVEHIDRHLGEAFNILRRRNLLDNTLILFTSDNGMPFPRAKATLYDYGTRVPLIAWWGGNITPGRRVPDLVSLTDVAPTLLALAGMPAPPQMSGRSLLPLLSTEPGHDRQERGFVYLYRERHGFYPGSQGASYPSRAIRSQDHLLIWNAAPDAVPLDIDGGPTKTFMEAHQAEYPHLHALSFGKRDEYELYDLKTDPEQMRNLAADSRYAAALAKLRAQLLAYLAHRQDPRIVGDGNSFRYAPYFGVVFQEGLLQWAPEQQGQNLTFEERRHLLRQAFARIDEEAFLQEVIRRQGGKL